MKPLLPLLLAAGLLTACTDDPAIDRTSATPGAAAPPSAASSASPVASEAPSAAPVETVPAQGTPAFAADTSADTGAWSGAQMTVVAVRAARQDGFDRIVFELRGKTADGIPGWRVEYVDEARQDGSGNEVDVAGDSILSVFIEGSGLPFDTGQEEASQDLTPKDTDRVREVDLQATFEGRFTAFVGVDQRVPFRVFRLADPARVVVDVRHG